MKRWLTILTLIISLNTNATQWFTYFVYFETEYIQGPWTRTDLLEQSAYKYLASEAYEDLFGSEQVDMANKMLSRLKAKKPDVYDWPYDLIIQGDTVILTPGGPIDQLETVKNEITATLTLNNFKAVIFQFTDRQETLTTNDLTLPYLDLVTAGQKSYELVAITENKTSKKTDSQASTTASKPNVSVDKENHYSWSMWMIISGILNLGLIGVLIMIKKK